MHLHSIVFHICSIGNQQSDVFVTIRSIKDMSFPTPYQSTVSQDLFVASTISSLLSLKKVRFPLTEATFKAEDFIEISASVTYTHENLIKSDGVTSTQKYTLDIIISKRGHIRRILTC